MRFIISVLFMLLLTVPVGAEPFMSPDQVKSASGYRIVELAGKLTHPWSMTWLPDGSMLITERPGHVRHFKDGKLLPREVAGSPKVLVLGQGGLLDISLHPDFEKNRLVYFTMATGTRQANRTTLARAVYEGGYFRDVQEVFKVTQEKSGGQHFGSRMVWLPDGTLLMSIGDGGNPPVRVDGVLSRTLAQDPLSNLGKVLHLNYRGDMLDKYYTMGHRNVQGMAWDPIRRTVWVSEHGASGGDELNKLVAGGNFGWPKATFSKEYIGGSISEHTSLPGMEDPALVWLGGIAPSGLAVYTGDKFPQWRGDLFAGGLRDQSVRRIRLDASGRVTGEQIIRIGARVRDVRQGPDGFLYLLTDESDGRLLRLEPSNEAAPNP